MTKRNPAWTEDELILALDLYFTLPHSKHSSSDEQVISLSQTLNVLRAAEQVDVERFRNPNGVALKLHNFRSLDPNKLGAGMSHGGRLDADIWKKYAEDRPGLMRDAAVVRSKVKPAYV